MKEEWWLHGESRPGLRRSLVGLSRFILTPEISKHRVFAWANSAILADHKTRAFGSSEDWFFGILHSRIHELWSRAVGTQLRESSSGFTYTPSTCFETFPFPFALKEPLPQGESTPQSEALAAHRYFSTVEEAPSAYGTEVHRAAIAAAAKELNDLRERWLNPPEWTKTVTLEFPGSVGGPWNRFIDPKTVDAKTAIGTVRYPRLEPRDAKCAAELKKRTLTALYNERPAWLDHAHQKLDTAVAAAYGWPADLTDEQILERLLALNLQRAAAEAKTAAAPKQRKPQRTKSADELI
jgi:hypothetical protein